MAGGGRFKIKGGLASKREAVVEDGALLITAVGGIPSGAGGRFEMNFYGQDSGSGVTSVELMEENTEIGIPLARALKTGNVAVKFRHVGLGGIGPWTLRLFKNGALAATFSVATV